MRRELMAVAAVSVSLIGVAACGGGSKAHSGSAATGGGAYSKSMPSSQAATGPTVKVSTTKLGRILTDGQGRTLYLFEKDKGTASTCYGACASLWPPLLSGGKPVAAKGAAAAKLGTTRRKDGRREVTYAGHPLYLYAGDHKPGDVTGQGLNQFGAKWYVLAPSGRKIDDD
jgi:predicted lipoprotein with Yx(FWY)xxD motif